MRRFYLEPKNWTLSGNDHLQLTRIESQGQDLDDLLCNAEISLETWHGNEGPNWTLGDLSTKDYAEIERLFAEFLAQVPDRD